MAVKTEMAVPAEFANEDGEFASTAAYERFHAARITPGTRYYDESEARIFWGVAERNESPLRPEPLFWWYLEISPDGFATALGFERALQKARLSEWAKEALRDAHVAALELALAGAERALRLIPDRTTITPSGDGWECRRLGLRAMERLYPRAFGPWLMLLHEHAERCRRMLPATGSRR